jgi:maltose O-acetyltransferase
MTKRLSRLVGLLLLPLANNVSFRFLLPKSVSDSWEVFRRSVFKRLGANIGPGTFVRFKFFCTNYQHLTIGRRGTIGMRCEFYAYAPIRIGNDALIGSDVVIHTAEHRYQATEEPYNRQGSEYREVAIGKNVYIGSRVVILAGAVISDGAIVAANSVVKGVLQAGGMYGGSPAKLIRKICT